MMPDSWRTGGKAASPALCVLGVELLPCLQAHVEVLTPSCSFGKDTFSDGINEGEAKREQGEPLTQMTGVPTQRGDVDMQGSDLRRSRKDMPI